MASSESSCDPCSRKKLLPVMAIKYCTNCAENLCMDCVYAHSSFNDLSSHNLIDAGSLHMETLSGENSCTRHEEMVLEFFCVEHDCLCCRSCMAETHHTCRKLVPVDDASKAVRRSPMLYDVCDTASSIRGTVAKLIINRDENLMSLNDEEEDVLKNISRIKLKILERLDDLERKVISELKSSKTTCETQIKSGKETLSKIMESVDEVNIKLDILSKHGSENQLFVFLHSHKLKVSNYEIKLREIISSVYTSRISFKQLPHQQPSIESFGSVYVKSTPCPMEYKVSKSKQAQVLTTTLLMPTKFKFDFKFDAKFNCIVPLLSSIALIDENRLLLCNHNSTRLLVYSDRGKYLHNCTLSGEPWDIAIIPGEDKAVVSLPYQKSIQFVDMQSMKSGGTRSVPDRCYGIAVVGDNICASGKGKIYILNKSGKQTTAITIPGGREIRYLHPGPHDSVYYTDRRTDTVGCVKLSGEVRFICTPENFKCPEALTTDKGGNLYVACYASNNIHRLSPDGIFIDILDHENKISKPRGLAFSRNYRSLFVTNLYEKSVCVFICYNTQPTSVT